LREKGNKFMILDWRFEIYTSNENS